MRAETIGHTQAGFASAEIEQSIPDRFAKAVARFPDRTAVSMDGVRLSYRALDQAANRIAGAILAHRGDAEEPVCLLFDQGRGWSRRSSAR